MYISAHTAIGAPALAVNVGLLIQQAIGGNTATQGHYVSADTREGNPQVAQNPALIIQQAISGNTASQGYYVSAQTESNKPQVAVDSGEIILAGIRSGARSGHGWMEYVSAQEGYYGVNAVGSFIDPLGSPRVGITNTPVADTPVTTYATAYLNGAIHAVYVCDSAGSLNRIGSIH
jgi:hypothetical protein